MEMESNDSTVNNNNMKITKSISTVQLAVAAVVLYVIFLPLSKGTQGHKLCYMQL